MRKFSLFAILLISIFLNIAFCEDRFLTDTTTTATTPTTATTKSSSSGGFRGGEVVEIVIASIGIFAMVCVVSFTT